MGLRRFLPRYSLRTLALFPLVVMSAMGLWWHWEPWTCELVLEGSAPLWCAAFSPDSELAAAGDRCGVVRLWHVRSGKPFRVLDQDSGIRSCNTGEVRGVTQIEFSPDGRTLTASSFGVEEAEWGLYEPVLARVREDAIRAEAEIQEIGPAWAVSRDGARAVAYDRYYPPGPGVERGKARRLGAVVVDIYDRPSLDGRLLARLSGHEDLVPAAVFSRDGQTILTAGLDGTARIWRLRHPERWWGAFGLWEFWLTVAFAGVFAWSIRRDRRALAPRISPQRRRIS